MRYRGLNLLILFAFLFCTSCESFQKSVSEIDEQPVARVGDNMLYHSDIEDIVKTVGVTKDSAELVRGYIDDWIKRNLVLEKAATYLPPEKLDIDKQVKDYQESLIIHLYERELILQKLDTTISEQETKKYYQDFKSNFELREDIVQFYYIKLANAAPKLDSAKLLIKSQTETDKIKLADYCFQYAEDFSIIDSIWYQMDGVYKQIPIEKSFMRQLINYKSSGFIQDSIYTYLLKINDFKTKGELAPFHYVINDISKIILNKRKIDLINSTYQSLYQDGVRMGNFEIYK